MKILVFNFIADGEESNGTTGEVLSQSNLHSDSGSRENVLRIYLLFVLVLLILGYILFYSTCFD